MVSTECPPLTAPENGNVEQSRPITAPDPAFYSCNEGYTLIGDDRRFCVSAGFWTGEEPTCSRKHTNDRCMLELV